MRRLDEIDRFMRDFDKFIHAPQLDIKGEMRQRLMMMLANPPSADGEAERVSALAADLAFVAGIMRKQGLLNAVVPVDKAAGYLRAMALNRFNK